MNVTADVHESRFSEPVLPLFRARAHPGERSRTHTAVWSILCNVWNDVEAMSTSVGCTSTDFLLTAVAVCLSRTYAIENDLAIGLACTSVVPLRVRVDDGADFIVNMQRVAAERRRAAGHATSVTGVLDETRPRLDVVLCLQARQGEVVPDSMETISRAPLSLILRARGDTPDSSASLAFQGESCFVSADEVERVRRQLEVLSCSVLAAKQSPVWMLPLMSDAERRRAGTRWRRRGWANADRSPGCRASRGSAGR